MDPNFEARVPAAATASRSSGLHKGCFEATKRSRDTVVLGKELFKSTPEGRKLGSEFLNGVLACSFPSCFRP